MIKMNDNFIQKYLRLQKILNKILIRHLSAIPSILDINIYSHKNTPSFTRYVFLIHKRK